MSVVSSAVGLLQQTTETTRDLVSALVAEHTLAIAIVPAVLLTLGVIYNAVFFSVLDIPVLHLSSTIDFLIPGLRQIFTALIIVFGGLCLILALAALVGLSSIFFAGIIFLIHSSALLFAFLSVRVVGLLRSLLTAMSTVVPCTINKLFVVLFRCLALVCDANAAGESGSRFFRRLSRQTVADEETYLTALKDTHNSVMRRVEELAQALRSRLPVWGEYRTNRVIGQKVRRLTEKVKELSSKNVVLRITLFVVLVLGFGVTKAWVDAEEVRNYAPKERSYYDELFLPAYFVSVILESENLCPTVYAELLSIGSTTDFLFFWEVGGDHGEGGVGEPLVFARGSVVKMLPVGPSGEANHAALNEEVGECSIDLSKEVSQPLDEVRELIAAAQVNLEFLEAGMRRAQAELGAGFEGVNGKLDSAHMMVHDGFAVMEGGFKSAGAKLVVLEGLGRNTRGELGAGFEGVNGKLDLVQVKADEGLALVKDGFETARAKLVGLEGLGRDTQAEMGAGFEGVNGKLDLVQVKADEGLALVQDGFETAGAKLVGLEGLGRDTRAELGAGFEGVNGKLDLVQLKADEGLALVQDGFETAGAKLVGLEGLGRDTRAEMGAGFEGVNGKLDLVQVKADEGLALVKDGFETAGAKLVSLEGLGRDTRAEMGAGFEGVNGKLDLVQVKADEGLALVQDGFETAGAKLVSLEGLGRDTQAEMGAGFEGVNGKLDLVQVKADEGLALVKDGFETAGAKLVGLEGLGRDTRAELGAGFEGVNGKLDLVQVKADERLALVKDGFETAGAKLVGLEGLGRDTQAEMGAGFEGVNGKLDLVQVKADEGLALVKDGFETAGAKLVGLEGLGRDTRAELGAGFEGVNGKLDLVQVKADEGLALVQDGFETAGAKLVGLEGLGRDTRAELGAGFEGVNGKLDLVQVKADEGLALVKDGFETAGAKLVGLEGLGRDTQAEMGAGFEGVNGKLDSAHMMVHDGFAVMEGGFKSAGAKMVVLEGLGRDTRAKLGAGFEGVNGRLAEITSKVEPPSTSTRRTPEFPPQLPAVPPGARFQTSGQSTKDSPAAPNSVQKTTNSDILERLTNVQVTIESMEGKAKRELVKIRGNLQKVITSFKESLDAVQVCVKEVQFQDDVTAYMLLPCEQLQSESVAPEQSKSPTETLGRLERTDEYVGSNVLPDYLSQ